MRGVRVLTVLAAVVGLTAGLLVCLGPCCPPPAPGSVPSIGEIPCCGADGTSECRPTMQRADGLGSPATTPAPAPGFLFDARSSSSRPPVAPLLAASKRPVLARHDSAFRGAPLLI